MSMQIIQGEKHPGRAAPDGALPLVPFVNSIPALAIILLCFGMAERDGAVILIAYLMSLLSLVYVGGLLFLVFYSGMHYEQGLLVLRAWFN